MDVDVKCPFYLVNRPKDSIKCEGMMKGVKLILRFNNRQDCRAHMRTFCENKYENCGLHRMLAQIYEEG